MKSIVVLFLFALTTTASAQWSDTICTVTNGNWDDINPQLDHAGIAADVAGGIYGTSLKAEWLVFERWNEGSNAIAALRFSGTSLKWDSTVTTVSPARIGVVQKCPDVCTVGDGTSLAAWQEKLDSVWNIEYSTCNADSGNWSTPVELTDDTLSNTNVKVRALTDSSFALIWERGNSILLSVYKSGVLSPIDTLVGTNTDNTDFDFDARYFVWTAIGASGDRLCLVSAVSGSAPFTLSLPDTVASTGDMSDPRFMVSSGSSGKPFTFDLHEDGRYTAWLSSSTAATNFTPEELAGDTGSSYLHAVLFSPAYLTSVQTKVMKTSLLVPFYFYAWEKQTTIDTSVVFYDSGTDSIQQGSNLSMSSLSFYVGGKTSLGFVVWQSDRSGKFHIYARDFFWTQTAINESTSPVTAFRLDQNYPNPFNPSTVISYRLSVVSHVNLRVYDILGREVATLVDQRQGPGTHTVIFDGSRFASGVYFYRLTAPGINIVRKMLLEK